MEFEHQPSTIHNAANPLRAIFDRALDREDHSGEEAELRLALLEPLDRAVWAIAFLRPPSHGRDPSAAPPRPERLPDTARSRRLLPGLRGGQSSDPSALRRRAYAAWEDAGLSRLKPHHARHTFASWLIAGWRAAPARKHLFGPLVLQGHRAGVQAPPAGPTRAHQRAGRALPQLQPERMSVAQRRYRRTCGYGVGTAGASSGHLVPLRARWRQEDSRR
jgi:hypothetical protein